MCVLVYACICVCMCVPVYQSDYLPMTSRNSQCVVCPSALQRTSALLRTANVSHGECFPKEPHKKGLVPVDGAIHMSFALLGGGVSREVLLLLGICCF